MSIPQPLHLFGTTILSHHIVTNHLNQYFSVIRHLFPLPTWDQIFHNLQPGEETVKIALIQPNLDPYTEKFLPENQARHVAEFFRTAETILDDEPLYLFGPETLIVQQIDEKTYAAMAKKARKAK